MGNSIIGLRLKGIRKSAGLSQEKLLGILGDAGAEITSQSMISDWETGAREPSPKILDIYAKAFNRDIRYIFGHIDEPMPMKIEFNIEDHHLIESLNELRAKKPSVYDDIRDIAVHLAEKRGLVTIEE